MTYKIPEDLGPERFALDGRVYRRSRVVLYNREGLKLEGSLYEPMACDRASERLPCVIYAHGNAGSQVDGIEVAAVCLPYGFSVFAFDFSGSGMSEGEWVSLGWKEADDLDTVISWLKGEGRAGDIAVWGRSMGAVTAMLHGQRCEEGTCRGEHRPAAYIFDSPFSNLRRLVKDVVKTQNNAGCVPDCVVEYTRRETRRYVRNKLGGDIFRAVDATQAAATCRHAPAMLGSGMLDELVAPDHVVRLYDAYAGEKCLVQFPKGNHNGERPAEWYDAAVVFLLHALCPPDNDRSSAAVPAVCRLLSNALPWNMVHRSLLNCSEPSWVTRFHDERDNVVLAQAQSKSAFAMHPDSEGTVSVVPLSVLADAHDRQQAGGDEDDEASPLRVWAEYKRPVPSLPRQKQAQGDLTARMAMAEVAAEVSSPVHPSPFRHDRPTSALFTAAPLSLDHTQAENLPGSAAQDGEEMVHFGADAPRLRPIHSPMLSDATNVPRSPGSRPAAKKKLAFFDVT